MRTRLNCALSILNYYRSPDLLRHINPPFSFARSKEYLVKRMWGVCLQLGWTWGNGSWSSLCDVRPSCVEFVHREMTMLFLVQISPTGAWIGGDLPWEGGLRGRIHIREASTHPKDIYVNTSLFCPIRRETSSCENLFFTQREEKHLGDFSLWV